MKVKIIAEIVTDVWVYPSDVLNSDTVGDYKAELDCDVINSSLQHLIDKGIKGDITILSAEPFEDGEDVWSDAKARGEIDESALITEDFLKINNFYKSESDCSDDSEFEYAWSNDDYYISVGFTDGEDDFNVLYESYDTTDGGVIKYIFELKSIFQKMGIPIQWKEVH